MRDHIGANAIWWSFPLGSLVTLILTVGYYRWGGWRKAHMLSTDGAQVESMTAA
jgi:Na+-driven multidrug efflux pump